jgi:hypothetical protein
MDEYYRLLFFGMMFCGLGPVLLIMVFCLFTGRIGTLFSKDDQIVDELFSLPVLRVLRYFTIGLFPIFFILLGVIVFLSL